MESFSNELIAIYSLYGFFIFYLQKWSREFAGASQNIRTVIDVCMIIFTTYGIGFLFYLGYKFGIINTLKFWGITLLIDLGLTVIETIIFARIRYSVAYIGMVSIVVCPILGIAFWFY